MCCSNDDRIFNYMQCISTININKMKKTNKKIGYVIMSGDDYVTQSISSRNNGYAFTHNLQGATFFDTKQKADNCIKNKNLEFHLGRKLKAKKS